jgi:hypothetical protein
MSSTLTPAGWVVKDDIVDERNPLPRLTQAEIDDLNARIAAGDNHYPTGTQVVRVSDETVFQKEGVGAAARFIPASASGLRSDLAATGGAALVGHGGTTVADRLNALQLADYAALRAYAGSASSAFVYGDGIAGLFTRDDADTTSADNGGTIIVASNGKRWKRGYSGGVAPEWFGAVGDGVADDSSAIDSAKAVGAMYLRGTYKYTNAAPASVVRFVGPGKVTAAGGTPHPSFGVAVMNSALATDQDTYVALQNIDGSGNATRLYVVPKTTIATGVGSAIKWFADNYLQDNANYRDFGIYFSADQGGDTGYNGDGVFWLNQKSAGTRALDFCDIGFSFADGAVTAGRVSRLKDGLGDRACWVFGGATLPQYAPTIGAVRVEFVGEVAFTNNNGVRFANSANASNSGVKMNASDELQFTANGSVALKINSSKQCIGLGSFAGAQGSETANSATINALAKNSTVVGNTGATTVTAITNGAADQRLVLIFANGNTTIQNNAGIKLAGGVNWTATTDDTLTLIYTGSAWYEIGRSVN